MSIPIHPSLARVTRDVRIYRAKIDAEPELEEEIKKNIKKRDPVNFPNPGKPEIKQYAGYKVFAYHQEKGGNNKPGNEPKPERLGGGLEKVRPKQYESGMGQGQLPPPIKGQTITWNTPPDEQQNGPLSVEIRADGTIVHTDAKGHELPRAHYYLHAVFNDILYTVRDLVEGINISLENYADNNSTANAQAYGAALARYTMFEASLQENGDSVYAGAFHYAKLMPVITNEGFVVSLRVKLNWKNSYHSSSTIKIP